MNKKILAVLTLLTSIAFLITACIKPDFTDHLGNSGKFSDFKGKWLVINYWATWCKPCIKEIPELNELAQQHLEQVVVLGVDFDNQSGEVLLQAIEKLAIQFPIINDPSEYFNTNRPIALPSTLIISPDGKLHKTLLGPQTRQELLAVIADQPL